MVFRVVVTSEAQRDLREIQRYIARDSFLAAQRFVLLLRSKTKILERHPEIGRVIPEVSDRSIRELVVGSYRVIYEINFPNKRIEILRYWHAARGVPKIFS